MSVFEHRRIYEKHYGKIPMKWHVHHIDGNHQNNNKNNLIAVTPMVHEMIHKMRKSELPTRATIRKLNAEFVDKRPSKKILRRLENRLFLAACKRDAMREIRERKKDRYLDKPFRRRGDIPTSDGFDRVTKIQP